jgi:hypothetical protein
MPYPELTYTPHTLLFLLPSSLQQPLPRQLDLLHCLPFFVPSFTRTHGYALAQLDFIFDVFPGAGTVVREVDA